MNPERCMLFIPSDGSTYERMASPSGDWIYDPDRKIDVSNFYDSENEHAIEAQRASVEGCEDCKFYHRRGWDCGVCGTEPPAT